MKKHYQQLQYKFFLYKEEDVLTQSFQVNGFAEDLTWYD